MRTQLSGSEAAVWEAYSQGLQQPLDGDYRWAARIAFSVTLLAVDQHLGAGADGASAPQALAAFQQIIAALEAGAAG